MWEQLLSTISGCNSLNWSGAHVLAAGHMASNGTGCMATIQITYLN